MRHSTKKLSISLSPLSLLSLLSLLSFTLIPSGLMAHDSKDTYQSKRTHQDIDSIFGGISVKQGESVRDISGVNGGVSFADNSSARNVETVNGGVKLGSHVSVRSIETVNGGIKAKQALNVEKSVETVNGGIKIGSQSTIGENIKSVNGSIHLNNVLVKRNVKNTNGDIHLINGSIVEGNLILAKSDRWFTSTTDDSSDTIVKIDATSKVLGEIHLYRAVILEIAEKAEVGKVVKYYSEK